MNSNAKIKNIPPKIITKKKKYTIKNILKIKISTLYKNFKHKTEQKKLKTINSNPSTYNILTTIPTKKKLSKIYLIHY